ncbi:glycosyltransferase [Edwardsiella anguillarum]|nr:glycosyltransferase [Edwardsiella anguillarum]
MGLVIMEALANACPVIAFDINYGPADMIRDGENGFLIEDKQYRVFAEKVIAALRDRDGIQLLQDNAIRSAKEYTEFNFSQRWMTLLSQIELAKGCQLRLF